MFRQSKAEASISDSRCQKLLAIVALSLSVVGCNRPAETQRDNRRLMDAILTAVVIRNPKELAKDKELLETRRQEGKMSKTSFESLQKLIVEAEAGKWESAEKGLYEIRGKLPFPK